MNREIKFRAWNKETDKMIFPDDNDCYFEITDVGLKLLDMTQEPDDLGFYHYEAAFMQCTGLKGYMNDSFNDYEEKDVYQGDHITITYDACYGGFYTEETYSGVVDLDDTGTAFVLRNADYERQGEDMPNRIGDMEISFSFPDDDDLEQIYLHAFELVPDNIIINGNIYEKPELLKEDTR